MHINLLGAVAAMMFAMQAASPAPSSSPGAAKGQQLPLTMTGCVSQETGTPTWYGFADSATGVKYRVSGRSVRKYSGQRVEIVGGPVGSGLTIRGGFVPSTNVAAQAGNMDPAKVAVAQMPGGPYSGTGGVDLPELRVTRARPLDGSCK